MGFLRFVGFVAEKLNLLLVVFYSASGGDGGGAASTGDNAMSEGWRMARDAVLSEVLAISGGSIAGLLLASMLNILQQHPSIAILIPAFLGLRGDILGATSARLGTALHTGLLEPKLGLNRKLLEDFSASLFLGVLESAWIGFITHITCLFFDIRSLGLFRLILLCSLGGFVSTVVLTPITIAMAILTFRYGIDPDSVVGPIIMRLGDIVGTLCLLISVYLVLGGA